MTEVKFTIEMELIPGMTVEQHHDAIVDFFTAVRKKYHASNEQYIKELVEEGRNGTGKTEPKGFLNHAK